MRILGRLVRWSALAAAGSWVGTLWAAARPRPGTAEERLPEPPPGLPPARILHVPDLGEMFLREAAGPGTDAPTVLLVHGWMFPADLHWFRCYGPLSEVAHVLAADHRGHGRGLRPSQPFRLVDVADDLAALLRHLGTGPVVAAGYSMGGPVAQLLWQRHPDLVRGLVLCATSATFSARPRDRWIWHAMGALQLVLRLLPRHWTERLIRAQADGKLPVRVTRMLPEHPPAELRDLLPWMIGEFDRGSAEDVAEAGRELSRYDARGWLPSVDVPTAVIVTTEDRLVPVENQRDLAARIPGAIVHELPLDHDAMMGGADAFAPLLVKAVLEVT